MKARDYQQAAVDAAIDWMKKCIDPAVLDLATGAGKSFIIALIAKWLEENTGKKTLVLAPSKELVEQDREKYLSTGLPASVYCASIEKCLRHNVVFGTPQTVGNSIEKFGANFACVIIDEGDGITPTVKKIIEQIRQRNPKLRVLGLTATPYRLGTGYIYAYDQNGKPMHETECIDPFYQKLLYRVDAHELIERGFLTPPHADLDHVAGYDADQLELNSRGQFNARDVEQVFEGKGRLTSFIVADIVQKSYARNGVIIFAATVAHAYEVMESLPKENSEIIHGNTSKSDRELIIERFKKRQFKYLVNVSVLTVGFDAPHVDVVAILRATESVRLLQQIIGRGLRLVDPSTAGDPLSVALSEKSDCLVLDYAKNLERHCPDGDLFNPKITARKSAGESGGVSAVCPSCSFENDFTGRNNPDRFDIDINGYFVDLSGNRIKTDNGDMPAHHGRRCFGTSIIKGVNERCGYRWSVKTCGECEHENDITARYCEKCRAELVNPNDKLQIEFTKLKKDPYSATSDKVLSWKLQEWVSQAGNTTLRIDFTTEYRTFSIWYKQYQDCEERHRTPRASWIHLCKACGVYESKPKTAQSFIDCKPTMPVTVTARKERGTSFFTVIGYNEKEDEQP
jgi:DNA repair protein RadD